MRLTTKLMKEFPALAWISIVRKENVKVIHGKHVEVRGKFGVEGAWSGEFSQGFFANSNWFCGTGGNKTRKSCFFHT